MVSDVLTLAVTWPPAIAAEVCIAGAAWLFLRAKQHEHEMWRRIGRRTNDYVEARDRAHSVRANAIALFALAAAFVGICLYMSSPSIGP